MRSTCLHSFVRFATIGGNLFLTVLLGGFAVPTVAGIYPGVGIECIRILFTQ